MRIPGISKYVLMLILLLVWVGRSWSLDLRISLFQEQLVDAMLFTSVDGDYSVETNRGPLGICPEGDSWYVVLRKDSLLIRDHAGAWHHGDELRFSAADEYGVFRLKPVLPLLASREYLSDLQVEISMNSLLMLNEIDMEKYIMGVSETEAGSKCELEYYKVQSILCRTFALKNFNRHEAEGFNLCDGVHCQAYKGRNIWNEDVEIGTEVTDGLVLVDEDSLLLNAAFHSNSGGETRGAEEVWLNGKNYLLPVLDPFSLNQPSARWRKSIPVNDWISYLQTKGIFLGDLQDTSLLEMHVKHRENYYRVALDSLLFLVIRDDLELRSDFFGISLQGDQVVLEGRGYGHGVGLSQEGAMEMARRSYHYTAILNYYYHQIQIIQYMFLEETGKLQIDMNNLP
ncbi:MAG: SpoIID/LytB domain-containing protein [Bacteroidales bacterium]|nr:SpoIID/LytB domain-containing protein [Bacteroidales bacterium]